MGVKLQLAYTFASGNVDVIYVVDKEYGEVYVGIASEVAGFSGLTQNEMAGFEDLGAVPVRYTGDDLVDGAEINMSVEYTTSADGYTPVHSETTTGVYDADAGFVYADMNFLPRGNYKYYVTIKSVDKTVSVDASALTNFSFDNVKVNGNAVSDVAVVNKTWKDELALSDSVQLVLKRANVAANTEATISYTLNGKAMTQGVTFNDGGVAFATLTGVTKAGNAKVVITGITATYTLRLGDNDRAPAAVDYNFSEDANGNVIVADDVLEITGVVPGDVTTIYIQRHGTFPATTDTNDILEADFGTVVDQESVEAIGNLSVSGKVFTFKVVLGSNASTINVINVGAANEVTTA